jgi:purine-binding chemotaxis protein CheW
MTATAALAATRPAAEATGSVKEFLTFFAAGQMFGLPLLEVHDVLDARPLTPVPLAPKEVVGMLNLRGRIITAIDIRRRMGLPERPSDSRHMSLVVEHDGEMYNLVVDTVGDVLAIGEDRFDETPPTLDALWKTFASGVYRLDQKLMVVLNVAALLHINR